MDEGFFRGIQDQLDAAGLRFAQPPVVIGGMAMEFYGIRKSGADIDLVITDEDYQALALRYPEKRKDIYGDLGVVIGPFEIWRSIALLDYAFFAQGSVDAGSLRMVSLDRLLFTRVSAMEVEKYRNDLELIKQHYYKRFQNSAFYSDAEKHAALYQKSGGTIFAGKYEDA